MCLVNKEDKLPFEKVLKMISYRLIDPERFLRCVSTWTLAFRC